MGAASREMVGRHDINETLATFEGLYYGTLSAEGRSAAASAGNQSGSAVRLQ
jgi:hypothetical protein